ncbi:GNAT family N-acetyltransferase [Homoserinibacter sp. YIM 151385]|uniref:GNAT family N-acetyltransferase n=1 Tax=Homoserinibacter sp. YIM 151385 TaxID=2985506 RepID=UPI0022F05296|nr:GNAT family N-acetyltransferase [Homoserinibacter sp. YIM 151385]WBU36939.1 GNAT family N-acetyltransferase [Homoserinibacter sp. YIM 151385]
MPDLIRLALPADAAALHRIAALTFPLACPPDATEAAKRSFIAEHLSEEAFGRYLADPARILLIAVEASSGEPLGYTMLIGGEPSDEDVAGAIRIRPTIELSKIYVHPGHHGAGLAARLMASSLDAARGTGAAGIWLGVNDQNARANAFYARQGFEQVGRKRFRLGDRWESDFVRERPL